MEQQLFLVNGRVSRLAVGSDCIVWRSVGQSVNHADNLASSNKSQPSKQHDSSRKSKQTTAGAEKAANKLSFSQIIGTNHHQSIRTKPSAAATANDSDKGNKKLKLYYAKDNEFKSTSRLLKFKSLTIESITQPSGSSSKSSAAANQQQGDSGNTDIRASNCNASPNHLSSRTSDEAQVEAPQSAGAQDASVTSPAATLSELRALVEARLELERKVKNRPRRLLVFVNPYGGKGKAVRVYKSKVRRLLAIANVETKLIVTKYANHARESIENPAFKVEQFDAIICIGGDGMFSELMNGLLFRYNRDKILAAQTVKNAAAADQQRSQQRQRHNLNVISANSGSSRDHLHQSDSSGTATTTTTTTQRDALFIETSDSGSSSGSSSGIGSSQKLDNSDEQKKETLDLEALRAALGGIGQQFESPPLPIGVIGAGSTDANSFGLIGTNDVTTATLNIILGKQIKIDICSVHTAEKDSLLKFVSTFVAYGYFGDVIRESERLRWLGPSRYDVIGVNNLIKNRAYEGRVRILISSKDDTPKESKRCHIDCELCQQLKESPLDSELKFIERRGSFVGVNAAVTACRCPQTKKGFSPNNHLANGCVDLILVRPCSRMQFVQYLLRTGWTKKSVFDLKYVEAYRCRQFEFLAHQNPSTQHRSDPSPRPLQLSAHDHSSSSSSAISSASNSDSLESKNRASNTSSPFSLEGGVCGGNPLYSSWNVDGEILDEASIRVKVNNKLLRVFGSGEPISMDGAKSC